MIENGNPSSASAPPQYSPDGRYWWDGATWRLVESPPPPPSGGWADEAADEGWEPGSFPLWIGSLPTPLGALLTHHSGFAGFAHLAMKIVVVVSTLAAAYLAMGRQGPFFVTAIICVFAWYAVWMMHLYWVAPRHYDRVNAATAWLAAMLRQQNQRYEAQQRWQAQQRQAAVQREILNELRHDHHHHHHR